MSAQTLKKYLTIRWFLVILAIKILFSLFLASDVMVHGFLPFLNFFVESGFQNPYNHFLSEGMMKAFPYAPVMLWVLAAPMMLASLLPDLFLMHIPVLLGDMAIYLVLCSWLPCREKKVLLYYWASPILFYINYIHGQLDVIPTAMLFLSLATLFLRKELLAYILLGVGIATKTHLLAAVPFYFLYSYLKKTPFPRIGVYLLATGGTLLLLLLPYVFSPGYQALVLGAEEPSWIFLLNIPFVTREVTLFLVPLLYLVLFFRFASYAKITQDLFVMMLGLMFAVLVILVPPMPGWFYWSVPFLAYFYSKKEHVPSLNFWLLNIFFLAYFLLHKDSDVLRVFQLVMPSLAELPTPFLWLQSRGIDAALMMNLSFTALQAALIMNVVWCYKAGIADNFTYKEKTKPLLIGIGGDSGAGKTRLAGILTKLFHEKNVVCIRGDDAHRWPRGHLQWEVFTHLNPKSNRLHEESEFAVALKAGHPVERVHYDHATGTFSRPEQIEPNKVILFEGLHPYSLKRTRDLFDLKIFLSPAETLRTHWKILRDTQERGHVKEKVLEQISRRRDDAGKYILPQKELADIVIGYEPTRPLAAPGQTEEPVALRLKITVENSIDVEPFVQALVGVSGLEIEYTYDDLDHVSLICEGHIAASEMERVAFTLMPNLRELTQQTPVWEEDSSGVIQLFVLYYLSQTFHE